MKREATISQDGLYRFDLSRKVEPGCECDRCKDTRPFRLGYVLFCLNNPSIADGSVDDATERRGWAFTKRWGYGHFIYVNTNPSRSTEPPIEPPPEHILDNNDLFLSTYAKNAAMIVAAWGGKAFPPLAKRAEAVMRSAIAPYGVLSVLDMTKDGVPKHPLYLPGGLYPRPW